jgi:hypothetical protein
VTVIDLTTRTECSSGIACEACLRTLEADWVVFTGRRWMCGQCLSSEAYDTGFREACRRLGVNVMDAVLADPTKRVGTGATNGDSPPQDPTL